MENTQSILNNIINMNLSNYQEAYDMLIALYGYMDKRTIANIGIELEKHYDTK